MGKNTINHDAWVAERYGLDSYGNYGRKWGRRSTDIGGTGQVPVLHRMQESREVQRDLYDYDPSGGSCEGLTAASILEDEQ